MAAAEETKKEYHHIRVKNPEYFHSESFRVIEFGEGIKATIGCKKEDFSEDKCEKATEVQKILFPKDKYTKEGAIEWVRKHPKLKVKRKQKK